FQPGDTDLWAIEVDADTGRKTSDAIRFTNSKEGVLYPLDISEDAKRMLVLREQDEFTLQAAKPGPHRGSFAIQRLAPDRWPNRLDSWTRDGKAVIFESERSGKSAILQENVTDKTLNTLMSGNEDYYGAVQSADGR